MSTFLESLAGAEVPVIMELKPRDADGRDLFAGRTPAELVATYERLGAPCLSVVTGSWFGGDDALLREVATLTERPILKKDFVTSERQVAAATAQGAAAVLLTAELLPGTLTARLAGACLRHGVSPFVEVSDAGQLERLGDASGCVVAVNNKDIRRRERGEARIERSLELLPAVGGGGGPGGGRAGGVGGGQAPARRD